MTAFNTLIDTVAIFDSNFNQVFPDARPMKCTVRPSARIMEHPLENGQIIADYKIILPREIIQPLIVSSDVYKDVYAEINNLFETAELLTVQTRVSNFTNMVIEKMPHEERPDMFDVVTIELSLKQVVLVQPVSNFAPANPTKVDTQNNGQQNATTAPLPANSPTNNPQAVKSQFNFFVHPGG